MPKYLELTAEDRNRLADRILALAEFVRSGDGLLTVEANKVLSLRPNEIGATTYEVKVGTDIVATSIDW